MYESKSVAKVQRIAIDGNKICFRDNQKSFIATFLLAMNDY